MELLVLQVSAVFHDTPLYLVPTIDPVSSIRRDILANGAGKVRGRLEGYFGGWRWVIVHFLQRRCTACFSSLVITVISSFAIDTLAKHVSKQGSVDTDVLSDMTDEAQLGQYTEATC